MRFTGDDLLRKRGREDDIHDFAAREAFSQAAKVLLGNLPHAKPVFLEV